MLGESDSLKNAYNKTNTDAKFIPSHYGNIGCGEFKRGTQHDHHILRKKSYFEKCISLGYDIWTRFGPSLGHMIA